MPVTILVAFFIMIMWLNGTWRWAWSSTQIESLFSISSMTLKLLKLLKMFYAVHEYFLKCPILICNTALWVQFLHLLRGLAQFKSNRNGGLEYYFFIQKLLFSWIKPVIFSLHFFVLDTLSRIYNTLTININYVYFFQVWFIIIQKYLPPTRSGK